MPLQISGEGYREFSEPRFFECETIAHVRQIRNPVDRAHAIVAPSSGAYIYLYKFYSDLEDADDGGSILQPTNSQVEGRWRRILNSADFAGGAAATGNLFGSGSPEGAVTGSRGYTYFDTANQIFYVKNTGDDSDTGWLAMIGA